MNRLLSPLRHGFQLLCSRCMVLVLIVLGHLSAMLFVGNLSSGLHQIPEQSLRLKALLVNQLYSSLMINLPYLRPLLAVLIVVLLIRSLQGRPIGPALDILGGLLCLRCAAQFLMLNMLLLAPLRAGGMLLAQLVLFLPVITIAFGWLYWRLDSGARRRGGCHLRFEDEGRIGPFEYFHAAAMTLLQFEPTGATAASRLMKSLFVLHGVVMLDLVALTLSRAIGLASGG
ncbi:MAG: hypothetical protein VKI83_07385 [Synechococcaceae cyanobacterium]|nr:hypothetical protein [Synechococcaceae cyanobacterium]